MIMNNQYFLRRNIRRIAKKERPDVTVAFMYVVKNNNKNNPSKIFL